MKTFLPFALLARTFHALRSAGLRPGVSQPFGRRRVGDRRSGLWAFQGECEKSRLDAPQEKALHEELSNKPPRLNKQKRGQLLQASLVSLK